MLWQELMTDAEFAEAQRLQPSFRPQDQPPIELVPVPPQWAHSEADAAWLARLGLGRCHLPRRLKE